MLKILIFIWTVFALLVISDRIVWYINEYRLYDIYGENFKGQPGRIICYSEGKIVWNSDGKVTTLIQAFNAHNGKDGYTWAIGSYSLLLPIDGICIIRPSDKT